MNMRTTLIVALLWILAATTHAAEPESVVAIIGTGDMGDSLGPRFAELGYTVIYGSRDPDGEKAQAVVSLTGESATATTQREAAQAGDIVILAVPWPAMETVAQSLGSLDGKIVIDVSFPHEQGDDGYYVPMLETSSAEMIQEWNPGARVMKTFALQASYVIDDPGVVGQVQVAGTGVGVDRAGDRDDGQGVDRVMVDHGDSVVAAHADRDRHGHGDR